MKVNLPLAIAAVIAGIAISAYAATHRTPADQPERQQDHIEINIVEETAVYGHKVEKTVVEQIKADLQAEEDFIPYYHMSEEDIKEEDYWDDLGFLACAVMAEAGNQSLYGKRLVVDVILNRVESEDFPDTIREVIEQKNQFTVVRNGRIYKVNPTDECFEAVKLELHERSNSEVLYFTSEGWSPWGANWKKIGDHYFSTKK